MWMTEANRNSRSSVSNRRLCRALKGIVLLFVMTVFMPENLSATLLSGRDDNSFNNKNRKQGEFSTNIRERTRKVTDIIIAFDKDPEKAEKQAMAKAGDLAYNGEFKVLSISIHGRRSDFYCMLNISHMTFPLEKGVKPVQEMAVGFGRNREKSMDDSLTKLLDRISQNPDALMADASEGKDNDNITNQEFVYHIKSLRFGSIEKKAVCYIKFEYLEKLGS